jgi:hypothetical protein
MTGPTGYEFGGCLRKSLHKSVTKSHIFLVPVAVLTKLPTPPGDQITTFICRVTVLITIHLLLTAEIKNITTVLIM